MGHPFGDLLGQYLHRKKGLSQFKLANGVDQPPSVISEMGQGKRLTGVHARTRVVDIIHWLQQHDAIQNAAEANDLLMTAGLAPLNDQIKQEADLLARLAPNGIIATPGRRGVYTSGIMARHNLPAQFTSFIGRSEQITHLSQIVEKHRMVTLTGAGGVGKTRLALEIAKQALVSFPDGVWFVDLAPLSDPTLLPQAFLKALQAPENQAYSPFESLTTFLSTKKMLLVIDNCEHLLDGVAELGDQILRITLYIHLLTTSREAIHIPAEVTWQVPSLTRPPIRIETEQLHRREKTAPGYDFELLEQYESVELFLDRVRSREPAFCLRAENAWAVAHICNRLDGIPLALEMAAAWIDTLTIEEIAGRLSGAIDARFQMLTSSSRTVSHRQQTLRATIEWSFALLSPVEQRLFLRLTVFAGGWTADAAEKICADGSPGEMTQANVLPVLSSLIHKSLVIADRQNGQTRYRMLETIRQFAVEKMIEKEELEQLRSIHYAYFLDLAETPPIYMLVGPALSEKMNRLHREAENFRAALEWGKIQPAYEDQMLRLVNALWFFWYNNGFHHEGFRWISQSLERGIHAEAGLRGRAYTAMGHFMWGADTGRMAVYAEQGLALCRQANDQFGISYALNLLGEAASRKENFSEAVVLFEECVQTARASQSPEAIFNALFLLGKTLMEQGQVKRALEMFESCLVEAQSWKEARYMLYPVEHLSRINPTNALEVCQSELARLRRTEDYESLGVILNALGILLLDQADYKQALEVLTESVNIWGMLGLQWHWVGGTARVLQDLARAEWLSGDLEMAAEHYEESLRQFRQVNDKEMILRGQVLYGYVALEQMNFTLAEACFHESLQLIESLGIHFLLFIVLAGIGAVLYQKGKLIQAAYFFGAATHYATSLRALTNPSFMTGYDRLTAKMQTRLMEGNLAGAWKQGQAMSLEELKTLIL